MPPADDLDDDKVYRRESRVGFPPILYFLGGAGMLAIAALALAVDLMTPPERQSAFPLMIASTVIPSVVGVGLLSAGWRLQKQVIEVALFDDDIVVTTPGGDTDIPWDRIARVETEKVQAFSFLGGAAELDALRLVGHDGQRLATLTAELGDFKHLAKRVKAAVAARTGSEPDAAPENARRPKKFVGLFYGLFAVFLTVAYVFVAWDTRYHQVHERLLETEGVEVEATVTKHEMFNVTPRVEYQFTDAEGRAFERGAVTTQAYWTRLAGQPTVPVRYVRSNPEYSRLADGEVDTGPSLGAPWGYLLALAGIPLSGLVALTAWLRWTGREQAEIWTPFGPVTIKV